ncbi:MAG: EutN/CcmL family microcompartment protein [Candidatus Eiseniibacteriota bacterium]
MQYGEVIGTVVATRKVPAWHGQRLLWVQPVNAAGEPKGSKLVALDVVSAAPGQRVFFVRGREAAHALADFFNPADAAIVALVDRLEGPVAEAPTKTPAPGPAPRKGRA